MPSYCALAVLAALAALCVSARAQAPTPNAPWADQVDAYLIPDLSDEFDGPLDRQKWSVHGIENLDTSCPKWNGPPSYTHPDYSVYYATSTDPVTGNGYATHEVKDGELNLWIKRQPQEFFKQREYYCNSTTYKCNHDGVTDCFPTKFNGEPNYKNGIPGTYWGVVHDKCKMEPYCIPSPEHVTRKPQVYKSFVGPHLATRAYMRYGFVEARVKVPPTSALLAVWMHSDQYVNGYCRYRKGPDDRWNVLECPSAIRTRQWGEIDILEAINSAKLKNRYVPNVHVFSDHKGEFTDVGASASDDGQMGGGPIIILKNEFNLKNPSFSDVPDSGRVNNDFHYNPGAVHFLDGEWADDYYTVGMYWSPQEIRWYVNGKEVKRLRNKLVHIPMQIDLSMAFNVNWAGEPPVEDPNHLGKVDYVRAWSILSEDGEELPSDLPIDEAMTTRFNDAYGNGMGNVHSRFPQMDSYTTQPMDQTERMLLGNETALYLQQMSTARMEPMARMTKKERQAARREKRREKRANRRARKRAGGPGNRKRLRRRRKRERKQKNILLGNPERVARQVAPGAEPLTIADPERTALEDVNPNLVGAGWDTDGGKGSDPNLA